MNIVVCIKQVPATTNVRINPETNTLIRDGVEAIINPFDEYAIEEAIRIKERVGKGTVTVLTMGPPQAEKALRDALARGVDQGVLLSDRSFAGSDTLATSYTLAAGIRNLGTFDLILCGKQATDGDTAQVGPGIAEKLNIPHLSYARKIEVNEPQKYLKVWRMMEDGTDVLTVQLPALLTVVKEINEPRLPSLKGMITAKKAVIKTLTVKDLDLDLSKLGLSGSPTNVMKIFTPPARPGGETIPGKPGEQSQLLVDKLRKLSIV